MYNVNGAMTMDNNGFEALKDKIAKLLAKAEGTSNAAEAEAFMAKVNELLERHQIAMHEVRGRTGRESDPMGKEKGAANIYTSAVWYRGVASALAKYYGCEFIYWNKGVVVNYELAGRKSSRVTTELMLPFILTQVNLVARKYVQEQRAKGIKIHERAATGHIGQALTQRIWRLIKGNQAHRTELESRALVPIDNLEEYVQQEYGKLRQGSSTWRATTADAKKHAETISLHAQTTHDRRKMVS